MAAESPGAAGDPGAAEDPGAGRAPAVPPPRDLQPAPGLHVARAGPEAQEARGAAEDPGAVAVTHASRRDRAMPVRRLQGEESPLAARQLLDLPWRQSRGAGRAPAVPPPRDLQPAPGLHVARGAAEDPGTVADPGAVAVTHASRRDRAMPVRRLQGEESPLAAWQLLDLPWRQSPGERALQPPARCPTRTPPAAARSSPRSPWLAPRDDRGGDSTRRRVRQL